MNRFVGTGSLNGFPFNSSAVLFNVNTNQNAAQLQGDVRASAIGQALFNGPNSMFAGDCTWGIHQWTRTGSNWTWVGHTRALTGQAFRGIAGRNNAAGEFVILACTCTAPHALWSFNTVTRALVKVADAPAGTMYKGVSLAPITPGVTAPEPSVAPVASASPSASPALTGTNAFNPDSLLVVRTGDYDARAYALPSIALPTYIDEYSASGALLQSLPLPTTGPVDGSDNAPCHLSHGWVGGFGMNSDVEGQPQRSADGRVVVFPCYAQPNGTGTQLSSANPKVLAVVMANGQISTRTVMTNPLAPQQGSTDNTRAQALRTAISATGAVGIITSTATTTSLGHWAVTVGNGALGMSLRSSPDLNTVALQSDSRYSTIFGGAMYVSHGTGGNVNSTLYGIHVMTCAGVPCVPAGSFSEDVRPRSLPGTLLFAGTAANTTSPLSFVFENANTLWVAEDARRHSFQLTKYVTTAPVAQPWQGNWVPAGVNLFIDNSRPVHSLSGRVEGGDFVLYATQSHRITRIHSVTLAQTVLARAAPGQAFHGVALPPVAAELAAAPARTPIVTTPVPTPAPAAVAASVFQPSSLIVIRAGDGNVFAAGRAMPAFALEIDPASGNIMQTVAFPTEDSEAGYACTIPSPGTTGTSEAFALLSGDGQMLTLACAGRAVSDPRTVSPTTSRTIGILKADSSLDTSQRIPDAYYYTMSTG